MFFNIRRGLLFFLIITYFLDRLVASAAYPAVSGVILLVVMAAFFPLSRPINRFFAVISVLVGGLLLGRTPGPFPWHSFVEGFQLNLPVIILALLVPLLGSLARFPHYQAALEGLMAKAGKSRPKAVTASHLISHALASLFNVGAIGLGYQILAPLRKRHGEIVMAKSLNRGYSYGVIWSPSISAVALVLSYYRIEWSFFLPVALCPAAVLVFFSVLGLRGEKGEEAPECSATATAAHSRYLWEVLLMGALMVALIVAGELLLGIRVIFLVALLALVFPPCWSLATGQWGRWLKDDLAPYLKSMGNRFGNELLLFISSGVLTAGLSASGLAGSLLNALEGTWLMHSFGVVFIILALVVVPSVLGIHPIVTVGALLPLLTPGFAGYSGMFLALLLTTGWAIGTAGSPLTALNLILQDLTGISSWEIAYRWYGFRALTDTLLAGTVLAAVGIFFRV